MKQLTQFLFLLLAFQVMVSSCSSTKTRGEQGAMAKLWHNMNSHYNGYFNARELMTESLLALEQQHVDNYTQRLEMFPFLEVENPALVKEDMDVAIEKVAIVVKKHPYSNWVDDSYLLVGQAQLIKQDYESAEKTLRFLVSEFRPRPKRKKSKTRKGQAEEPEEEEFVSRREVEVNPDQERKNRLRARKDAQKERKRISRERDKERKAKKKEREQERKARARARKKGIKLPPRVRDTSAVTGLENEPEVNPTEDLGPIGMITLFGGDAESNAAGETYGKKSGGYLLKHRPAHQEGRLWLAWTLIKRDNFDRAQIILDDMRANRGTYTEIRRKALAVQAYNYLEQDRLEEALPFLEEAAGVAEERNESARYYYIAGQLYQELSQPTQAAGMFEEAIAAKPIYELELGARLNLAQNAFLSGTGSAEDAIKKLKRMAKEDKNIDYEAQILFTVAAVALRSGDEAGGAQYLREALNSPSAGPVQQLEAYQLLGDLAYNKEDFLAAKLYYDTTLTVMAEADERFAATTARRDQLTGIANNLTEIEAKDSLLRIGLLPEAERRKWAEELFEKQRAAAAAPVNPVASTGRGRGNQGGNLGNSDFFAYNPSALRKGRRDFERQWGDDRALEDNWRRSKRTDASTFTDPGDNPTSTTEETDVTIITEDEINKLLDGIPTEKTEQATMQTQLAQNWFSLGQEYRDKLENNPKALSAFETLNARYPASASEAESWYYQHLIHKQMGNATKAQEFADKLKKYRGSKFEKLANEPGYAEKLLSQENRLERDYETAYNTFEAGDYEKAHELATKGRGTLRGQHPLKARYALLLAMTTGHMQGRQAYIASLRQVVAQFANTPEQTRAKEILRLLGESGARIPGKTGFSGGGGNFKESMKELHYIIIVFDNKEVKLNDAKVAVAEYNKKYSKENRLRVTNVYIGQENDTPVLILRRFRNGEAAMKYLSNADELSGEFLKGKGFDYQAFAVSQSNYREVLKARSVVDYEGWYKENY